MSLKKDITPSILLVASFISDHAELFHVLMETIQWDDSMAARRTASFGVPYNYSQISYPQVPLLPVLKPVAAKLKDLLGVEFNNCLLNYYETGDNTMGFHSDDTTGLIPGSGVAIISLGSIRDITFRNKANLEIQRAFSLFPGSLLYMDSAIQDEWMHAIIKQKDAGPRISLTWRAFQ